MYRIAAIAYGNIETIHHDQGKFDQARVAWKKGIEHAGITSDWYSLS